MIVTCQLPVADPDLELRGGGVGFHLLALVAFLPSDISSFFTQIKKGAGAPLDLPQIT